MLKKVVLTYFQVLNVQFWEKQNKLTKTQSEEKLSEYNAKGK